MKDEMKGRENEEMADLQGMFCDDHAAQVAVIKKHFDLLTEDFASALDGSPQDETAMRLRPVLDSLWDRARNMSVELAVVLKDDDATTPHEICKRYAALLSHVGDCMLKISVNPFEKMMATLAAAIARGKKEGK